MRPLATSFASGLVFAVGLGLAGMTRPAKVIAFLDVAGRWDASLGFVMVGAIAVHAALYRRIVRRPLPLAADRFSIPPRTAVDARLVAGAALFGVGWGLAGYCPGPAIVSLASGAAAPAVFVVAMLGGMRFARLVASTSPVDRPKDENGTLFLPGATKDASKQSPEVHYAKR